MAIKVPETEEQYINSIYDKQLASTKRALESAYNTNISTIDTAKDALNTDSYESKRRAAGDAAITRQRLNETFAANGLNTGAVGQANLALLNQKAANLNDIELKRVAAQKEYDAQKVALTQAYQNEVKAAIEQNDSAKAQALYAAWKDAQAQAASSRGSGGGGDTAAAKDYYVDQNTGKVKNVANRSLSFSPDEGIFTWNGQSYSSVNDLVNAWNKTALSDEDESVLRRKFKSQTGVNLSDYGY